MTTFKRSITSMFTGFMAVILIGVTSGMATANGQGHGGGGGHFAGSFAGRGFGGYGGYGGYGYGGRGWGYGGYGWGWGWGGFGWGLGLGLGYGLYGWPYYGYGYPAYPYYGYSYNPYPYSYPPYPYPSYAGPGPNPNAFPIPIAPAGGVVSKDVTLIVRAPADAAIWINGNKTTQNGTNREFVSTGEQGRSYTFDIRAEWKGADGKTMELERRVPIMTGEKRLVDFTLPSP